MVEADPPLDFAAQGGRVLVKPPEERDEPGHAGETVVLSGAPVGHVQACQPVVLGHSQVPPIMLPLVAGMEVPLLKAKSTPEAHHNAHLEE